MNHLGLFSGIGGFEEAFRRAGANLIGMCEIEPQARRVLRRHFAGVEIINDVKEITRETFAGRTIDLITGGFPCQDLSVAGRRAGLAGERSGLWFEFIRIIGLHQPRWVVIENVPGLLSSNGGEDFAIILRGLVECGYCVAWRIFDSQYDGVAQRRERVFIVASLGSSSCAEVLFEHEGGAWDHPPSREAGEGIAAAVTTGIGKSCGPKNGNGHPLNLIAGAVSSKWAKGTGGPAGDECYNLTVVPQISHALTSEGADASEDGTGRGTPIVAYPLQEVGKRTGQSTDDVRCGVGIGADGDPMYTLQSGAQHGVATFDERNVTSKANRTRVEFGRPTNTLHSSPLSVIAESFGVRRLTPLECERLQGYPDGWTERGDDGREISDSARYRMLGNAVCLPTVEWIARRIFNN